MKTARTLAPSAAAHRIFPDERLRTASAVALAIAVGAVGAHAGIVLNHDRGPTHFLLMSAVSLFVPSWCWFDARARGHTLSPVATVIIFFIPFGFPIYCMWSRGFLRGLLAFVLWLLVVVLVYFIAFEIARSIVHG